MEYEGTWRLEIYCIQIREKSRRIGGYGWKDIVRVGLKSSWVKGTSRSRCIMMFGMLKGKSDSLSEAFLIEGFAVCGGGFP